MDVTTLTHLLQEAEAFHSAYESTTPSHHGSEWYARYIIAREQGTRPGDAAKLASPCTMESMR